MATLPKKPIKRTAAKGKKKTAPKTDWISELEAALKDVPQPSLSEPDYRVGVNTMIYPSFDDAMRAANQFRADNPSVPITDLHVNILPNVGQPLDVTLMSITFVCDGNNPANVTGLTPGQTH